MNLYTHNTPQNGERFDTLLAHKNIQIIRIVSSDTTEKKLYLQEEDEWVVVLGGEAVLEIEGIEKRLRRGESLLIPAHTPHRVLQTQQGTLWLAVHIS